MKREKKNSTASRGGKKFRRIGKQAENDFKAVIEKWGYQCDKVPMSGALKNFTINGIALKSDLIVTIDGKAYHIEVKRRANLSRLYALASLDHAVEIKDFCYLMSEEVFHALLNGVIPDIEETEDKGLKYLHNFFAQDGADIVAMRTAKQGWIVAVTYPMWEILTRRK